MTKQQGFLQNLVLDLKKSNINSDKQGEAIAQIKDKEILLECKICMDKPIKVALNPCGHTFCENCAKRTHCAICRERIVEAQKIYIP